MKKAVVLGMNGVRRQALVLPAAVSVMDADELIAPPADLSLEAQACWRAYAGHAVTERTLTAATVAGFRQCCQQWAYVAELEKRIQTLGPATKDAEGAMRTYIRLAQRLDASLGRFKLTAFGKPATAEKPKTTANPFAQVANK